MRWYSDHVVFQVAHQLELEFFPAQHRLFDEHLAHRAGLEAPTDDLLELFDVVRRSTAAAAERERGSDDQGESDLPSQFPGAFECPGGPARRSVQRDRIHCRLERLTVLRHLDRLEIGTDQLDSQALEDSALPELHGQVETRLPPDRRQHGIGALAFENRFQRACVQRFDVSPVGHGRIGHDRCRIRVDQHDLVAFLA